MAPPNGGATAGAASTSHLPTTKGVTITPLSGPYPAPLSYQLTLDSAIILLDCGAYDSSPEFPSSTTPTTRQATSHYLSTLRSLAPHLTLLLLSHPLLTSLGLLPWLRAKCGLRCPVYATLPTREMGRWAVEEWVEGRTERERNERREEEEERKKLATKGGKKGDTTSGGGGGRDKRGKRRKGEDGKIKMEVDDENGNEGEEKVGSGLKKDEDEDAEEEDPWDQVWKVTTKEIRDAFLSVTAIRWTQPVHLSGPLKGYTLTSHRSGHTLGGSLYTLRPSLSSSLSPASSSSSILYAPIFNHVKEHHLDSAALLNGNSIEEGMRRMGVVVVGGRRSRVRNMKRKDKESAFLDLITSTLRSSHSILLPTDPSARLLELLVLLESHWSFHELGKEFPLCLVTRTGRDVVTFLRSLTEWMGGVVGGEKGERVLRFVNLRIFPTLTALNASIPLSTPKLILTTPSTLSHGISREIFVDFAQVEGNLVMLTGEGEDGEGSLAGRLWGVWNRGQGEGRKWGDGVVGEKFKLDERLELIMKRKVYLEGQELLDYNRSIEEEAEREAKHQALLERSRRMMAADADSSDSDASSASGDEDGDGEAGEEGKLEEEMMEVDGPVKLVMRRRTGGFTGGAGAWDEFLDVGGGGGGGGANGAGQFQGRPTGANFDIYVKGSFARRAVGDATNSGKDKEGGGGGVVLNRFRMFPVIERKRRVDAYGEAIDVEGWLKRGLEEDDPEAARRKAQAMALLMGNAPKRAREEDVPEEKEAPHKYVKEKVAVYAKCFLFVVDLDGRTDGRTLKTILPQINPRKLVIVDGSPEDIKDLADACRSVTSMTEEIYTPGVGEMVKVGEETKNFSVRLGDTVMASLRLNRVDDYDVAFVSGIIQIDPESDIPVLERTALTNAIMEAPTAGGAKGDASADAPAEEDTAMADSQAIVPSGPPGTNVLPSLKPSLFIGDLKLTILKDRLRLLNVPSEFAGEGILVCGPVPPESFAFVSSATNVDPRKGARAIAASVSKEAMEVSGGKVAVRKMGRGRLVIEGSPGETFYVVRRIVYSLHASAS